MEISRPHETEARWVDGMVRCVEKSWEQKLRFVTHLRHHYHTCIPSCVPQVERQAQRAQNSTRLPVQAQSVPNRKHHRRPGPGCWRREIS
jgi:hypothetical protein